MFTNLMHAELATTRQRDLIAAAKADRLARQVRRASCPQRHDGPSARVRRIWTRSATQPAQV
jgi:hypothetical protein